MPREHANIKHSIWDDDEFRELTSGAQHLYFILLTHGSLNAAGVVDWRPGRLAPLASDLTPEKVLSSARELAAAKYIVIDEATEEALVRSFIRNDGLMKIKNMAVSMANAYGSVASSGIRGVIVYELRRLFSDDPNLNGWNSDRVAALAGDGRSKSIDPGTFPTGFGAPTATPDPAETDPSPNPSVNPSVSPSVDPSVNPSVKGQPNPSVSPSVRGHATSTSTSTKTTTRARTRDATPADPDNTPSGTPVDAEAWRLVRDIVPASQPHSVRVQLATQVHKLTVAGTDAAIIREAVNLWLTKPTLGPALLPTVVSEVIKRRDIPVPGAPLVDVDTGRMFER